MGDGRIWWEEGWRKIFWIWGLLFGLRRAIIISVFPRGVSLAARAWVVLLLRGGVPLLLLSWMAGPRQAVWRGFVITLIVVEGERAGTDRTNGTACGSTPQICPTLRNLRFPCAVSLGVLLSPAVGRSIPKRSSVTTVGCVNGESEVGDLV